MQISQPPRKVDLLLNDLYQFTCSYCYFTAGKHEQQATFEVFFRKYPFGGEYVIAAGLHSVKDFLTNAIFTIEHQLALRKCLPNLSSEYFQWLSQDFSSRIHVKSMREGEVIFAKEPIITYTGPLGFVQLLETPILNLIGFASLVATNASRMKKAVEPKDCIEFGLRRAQGPDGGLSASQYAFLGGFSGTSNIMAGNLFDIPVMGTMSHAFVTSFASLKDAHQFRIGSVNIKERALQIKQELQISNTHQGQLAAFIMYAKAFPDNFKVLIDTYNTVESGLMNTIIVGRALIEAGIPSIGIRLDSGDLCALSKKCREVWNKYVPGLRLIILASDDLHEERLVEMEQKGSDIDVYAIGTHIATCKKQPALGLVCKLVALDGVPKMKFSGDTDKATYPAAKSVHRVWIKEAEQAAFDLISLDGQVIGETVVAVQPDHLNVKHEFHIVRKEELNRSWGKERWTLQQSKSYLKESQSNLHPHVFALKGAEKHKILMTQAYLHVFQQTIKINSRH